MHQILASISKDFNWISGIIGVIGAFVTTGLGGVDNLLSALVGLVIIDYITGILKAWKNKEINSEIGFIGLIKKVMIFVMVAVAVIVESIVTESLPLRELVIWFYIANEGLSLIENTSVWMETPPQILEAFTQIRDRTKSTDKAEDDK